MKNKNQSKIFNPKRTKAKRKYLRNNMTRAERKLCFALKKRQLCDRKFRRQHGIGNYVVDFYCPELNLVVEVDGESHYSKSGMEHDKKRDQYFSTLDVKVVRFTNQQVFNNLDGVLKAIKEEIIKLDKQKQK